MAADLHAEPMTDDVATTAVRAVEAGGEYLRERFQSDETDAEYDEHDVKARADRESEARMLEVIREAHPDHRIYAEESGEHDGESDSLDRRPPRRDQQLRGRPLDVRRLCGRPRRRPARGGGRLRPDPRRPVRRPGRRGRPPRRRTGGC
jgi:3'-phosphoadenosine 5'-phosphosulfate (PAPS) 3'-phosphatase